eukprot:NODE_3081_length_820_cov_77.542153_g2420_i1.p1 GENE.NODE_3081_length_820_cov_77.542153_g2420_i1~~NODE_3081_length_820_cov_77.542153_g2420_i1.p1  ORF type:complete len:141 (+),score=25.47 NODE_3081_length_820_cov_77.542153_g2420_i1:382-804(+)
MVERPSFTLSRADQEPMDAGQLWILVVDDNPINRTVLCGLLSQLGFNADCAVDGLAAVAKASVTCYSLVFMDCQMPVMDGYQATQCIRQFTSEATSPNVPIIAVTAGNVDESQARCGMNECLPKPIQLMELESVLNRHLP